MNAIPLEYKTNEIVNKFLLAGDKFMPEMHLKQAGSTYSACGHFTKNKEIIQIFKETGDTKYIYRHDVDKTCFQHDMAYGYFKDLARRIASDKIFRDKAFNIAKNPKYGDCQRRFASIAYRFFDKNPAGRGFDMHAKLAEELQKRIIKKFNKRTVYSGFNDNIWDTDLAGMQLISSFNKRFRFLLCVIDIFSKYAWVVL